MKIEKFTIKIREEQTGNTYDVEISTYDLIEAIKNGNGTETLWIYITGYLEGLKKLK